MPLSNLLHAKIRRAPTLAALVAAVVASLALVPDLVEVRPPSVQTYAHPTAAAQTIVVRDRGRHVPTTAMLTREPTFDCASTGTGEDSRFELVVIDPRPTADVRRDVLPRIYELADRAVDLTQRSGRTPRFVVQPVAGRPGRCVPTVVHIRRNLNTGLHPGRLTALRRAEEFMREAGLTRPGRTYMAFIPGVTPWDAAGVAEYGTAGAHAKPAYGAVFGEWPTGNDFEAQGIPTVLLHEMLHTVGAVHPDAPYATDPGHCTLANDVMCYGNEPLSQACDGWQPFVTLDCAGTTYWNVTPARGSWLADHPEANAALSPFMEPFTGRTEPELTYLVVDRPEPGWVSIRPASHRYDFRWASLPKECIQDLTSSETACRNDDGRPVRLTVTMDGVNVPLIVPVPVPGPKKVAEPLPPSPRVHLNLAGVLTPRR